MGETCEEGLWGEGSAFMVAANGIGCSATTSREYLWRGHMESRPAPTLHLCLSWTQGAKPTLNNRNHE